MTITCSRSPFPVIFKNSKLVVSVAGKQAPCLRHRSMASAGLAGSEAPLPCLARIPASRREQCLSSLCPKPTGPSHPPDCMVIPFYFVFFFSSWYCLVVDCRLTGRPAAAPAAAAGSCRQSRRRDHRRRGRRRWPWSGRCRRRCCRRWHRGWARTWGQGRRPVTTVSMCASLEVPPVRGGEGSNGGCCCYNVHRASGR